MLFATPLASVRADADLALVRRAVRGNSSAGRILVDRLMPVIRARVRRVGRQAGLDAEDLAQEVWVTLVKDEGRQLLAWDPARGASLEGYVGLLARREAHNKLQSAQALKRGADEPRYAFDDERDSPELADPEQLTSARQLGEALWSHLHAELPARGRLILEYVYRDGRDAGEVAQILGVNRQVVYNWQNKIRVATRAFVEGEGGTA